MRSQSDFFAEIHFFGGEKFVSAQYSMYNTWWNLHSLASDANLFCFSRSHQKTYPPTTLQYRLYLDYTCDYSRGPLVQDTG
jgi:hypothetical protein